MDSRRLLLSLVIAGYVAAFAPIAQATPPAAGPVDVTASTEGRALATQALSRWQDHHWTAQPQAVLKVGDGEYMIASFQPTNLRLATVTAPSGFVTTSVSFDVAADDPTTGVTAAAAGTTAQWVWIGQNCFSRMSNVNGWLDSCYVMHKLKYETDPRDFYQLEQYGTVGASSLPSSKIYDGWLAAAKASSSATMSWIDYSPRGSIGGSCQGVPLSVSALGVSVSASGVMCERWNIYKGSAGGNFEEQWSCGCIWPFGQPFPNTRKIDYMQAISVPGGGPAVWTLSAGFTAMLGG